MTQKQTTFSTFALIGTFVVVVLTCCGMTWDTRASVNDVERNCEVHAASQDQRVKNIEASVLRNERTCERIEALLRDK